MSLPTRSTHNILRSRRSIGTDRLSLLVAAVQSNPTLGDIDGNVADLLRVREEDLRVAPKLDLMVCSELALCGYLPDDLLLNDVFLDACAAGIETLQCAIDTDERASLLLGAPRRGEAPSPSSFDSSQSCKRRKLFNSAVLLTPHAAPRWCDKSDLPNYGVFDEKRYFSANEVACSPLLFKGVRLGIMICQDMWQAQVASGLADSEAELFLVLNASPFERGKAARRMRAAQRHIASHRLPLLYVNQVGGQDEILFDGGSFALNSNKELFLMPFFETASQVFHFHEGRLVPQDKRPRQRKAQQQAPAQQAPAQQQVPPSEDYLVWQGLKMGIRDYAHKNDFREIVLGLSGGIDSALCAVLACDALGAERVHTLFLPSPYTSAASGEDARLLATRLGVRLKEIGLEDAMRAVAQSFERALDEPCEGVVAENIQARLRALFLMAYANRTGALLLATSNKSECATGYTTLYGDMGGGYAPLKDLYKTEVYDLARWRNSLPCGEGSVIHERILTKAPSAELRPEQRDEDALAPYDQLDTLLREMIEGETDASVGRRHVQRGEAALRQRVQALLRRSEHKRFQSPPGPKVGQRAFGRDRRYPIINRFCQKNYELNYQENYQEKIEKNDEEKIDDGSPA